MPELPCTVPISAKSSVSTIKRTASHIEMLCVAVLSIFCAAVTPGLAQAPTAVPVLTWRYDQTHAGQNTSETLLTTSNVSPDSFGKLFALKVDSTVYPQPLFVPNLKMSDGQTHNVLFIETSNDSMYAFDADSNGGSNASPIWKVSLAATDHGAASNATAIPWQDTGSPDVAPTVGITGTPVIDPATNTMYVVSNTKENGNYFARLHAIDITSGAEKSGSPVEIKATVAGTGNGSSGGQLAFSPLWENQRPALALYNGYVYIGFAAHGDNGPWHGWLFSYNASTLAQKTALCLSPNSYGSGIWASGAGLPIDSGASGGRMFVVTGNGPRTSAPPFGATTSYGESVVAFSLANGGITPIDEFTPFNYDLLNSHDWDLGSGGLLMVPDQQGAHPHVAVIAGKEGRITVVDRDNLGGFASGASSSTNALQDISGLIPQAKGFWSTAAYWNGNVYMWAEYNVPMLFKMNSGVLDASPDSKSTINTNWPSPTFSISSNGTQNGIAWAVRADQFNTSGPAVLYAWDANDLTKTIYESDSEATRDTAGPANRYSIPVVTNGKVYVATKGEIDVYGLLNAQQTTAAPVITPNGGTFSTTQSVTLSSTTASSSIYYTLDGSTPTSSSTLYSGPITLSTNTTLKAIASAPNYLQSAVSSAVFAFDTQTPSVTFTPGQGTYTSAQSVTLSDTDTTAEIHYTTDGTPPGPSSPVYSAPIQVSKTETISAVAMDSAKHDSNVSTANYVIQDGNSIDFSQGFSTTPGLTLNGSTVATNDTRLQLTDGGLNEAGSLFWSQLINVQAFTTTFEFQISGDAKANGFTFCIQNDPHGVNALGGNSTGLGYGGITKSVALKFNFYDALGSGSDSTGVYTNGDAPITGSTDIGSSGIQLNSGDSIQAQITYDGTTLTLTLNDLVSNKTFTWSQKVDIPTAVGGNTAYVGFTAGTGGLSSSQKLLSWAYNVEAVPVPPTPPAPAPSFAITGSAVAAIKAGGSSTSTITITPSGGFTGAVALTCLVTSPAGAQNAPTCTVDPSASISGIQAANATLSIKTTAPTTTARSQLPRVFAVGGETLAAISLLFMFPMRRRRWQSLVGALVLVFLLNAISGCGGTSKAINTGGGGGATTPGTTPGAYTITVTGTSGTTSSSATVNFSVQ